MNLFGCISDIAVMPKAHKSAVERHEDELINRILCEGLKLKTKCNSLNKLLSDTETQRQQDRENFTRKIAELEEQHTKALEEARTTAVFEIAATRENERVELEMLIHANKSQESEIQFMTKEVIALKNALRGKQLTEMTEREAYSAARVKDLEEISVLKNHLTEYEYAHQLMRETVAELTCERNTLMNAIQSYSVSVDEAKDDDSAVSILAPIARITKFALPDSETPTPTSITPVNSVDYEELQAKYASAQDEIISLNSKLQELLAAKQHIEYCVHQVLTENNDLKDKIDALTRSKKDTH
jgi:hypothetical protein